MIDEWRAALRDLELGARPYTFSGPITGLGNPPVKTNDFDVNGIDGSFAQGDNYLPRVLGLPITVHGANAAEVMANHDALLAAWRPVRGVVNEMLELHLPNTGRDSSVYFGRPRVAASDLTLLKGGAAYVLCEFHATDPFTYDAELSTLELPRESRTGGLLVPALAPFLLGVTGDSGTRIATNTGTEATWPELVIAGPATNPIVENVTTGKILRFTIDLAASDTLTVTSNPRYRSVFLNGTADRYSSKVPTSEWFALEPGDNLLRYSASGGTPGSTIAVTWRSAR